MIGWFEPPVSRAVYDRLRGVQWHVSVKMAPRTRSGWIFVGSSIYSVFSNITSTGMSANDLNRER